MATAKRRTRTKGQPQSGPRPRILRIGILLGDTFIEERLIRERKPVTVGQSAKNVFSIPIEKMPRSWPLFDMVDGDYVLKINKRMDGRVAVDGRPRTLESLKGREAKQTDDYWTLPLSNKSRGKIELGEMRLLFQFVAAPPLQPRPRLPASVRGTLADRIDPRLAMILAISIVIHFAVALWAFQHDKTTDRFAQKRLDDFRRDQIEIRTIQIEQPATSKGETATETADKGEEEKPTKKAAVKKPDKGGDENKTDEGPPDDATLEKLIKEKSKVVGVMGGFGKGPARYTQAADVDEGTGLDKGMNDLKQSGTNVAAFGKGDGKRRGPANSNIVGDRGKGKVGDAQGGGSTGPKAEEKITSRASFSGIDEESDGTLDPGRVARKIQSRYRRGLQQCHERLLKVNPRAGGRVQLSFTVGPTGRVTGARARGFDPSVDQCIMGQMRRWRFGTPKDEDGKPSKAKFSMPVILKAGT